MAQSLTLRLAFRNLLRNTRRTGLMVLLVASGLTAMMLTDGLSRGMIGLMINKVTDTWLGEAQIHAPHFRDAQEAKYFIASPGPVYDALDKDPDILAWAPRTFAGGMVASSNNVSPGAVIGVDPVREAGVSSLKEAVVEGTYFSPSETPQILIGYKMAELLEVELGDRIVTTVSEAESGEVSQALFRVAGFLKFNDRMMDKQMAFVTLEQGQKMLAIGEGVQEVALRIDKAKEPALAIADLKEQLSGEPVEILDWKALLPDLASILSMTNFSSLIVGGILFILVSLGLINSMFMSIYERHYEFGVMLGVGTRQRQLFKLILWEGTLIGFFGALFGVIFGGALNWWLSNHGISFGSEAEMSGVTINEPVRTVMEISQFTTFPAFVVALAALACIIPALNAARLVPAVALRRAL